MCYFDSKPVWIYYKDITRYENECLGEAHDWYYIFLLVTHLFFMIEFILRTITQKYQVKFLLTVDSFLEIFTTIPFIICYVALGTETNTVQFFVMIDLMRLLLLGRFTRFIESEITKEILLITMNISFICLLMAGFT